MLFWYSKMVNIRATNYDNKEQEKVIASEYENGDENEYSVSDKDSDYVPSADESVDSCEKNFQNMTQRSTCIS